MFLTSNSNCTWKAFPGNTKGGSITVPLTSCLTCLDESVLQMQTKIVSSQTAGSKPVKEEVNGTVILPPLVFPGLSYPVMFTIKAGAYLSGAAERCSNLG